MRDAGYTNEEIEEIIILAATRTCLRHRGNHDPQRLWSAATTQPATFDAVMQALFNLGPDVHWTKVHQRLCIGGAVGMVHVRGVVTSQRSSRTVKTQKKYILPEEKIVYMSF